MAYDEAYIVLNKSLKIYKKLGGVDHLDVTNCQQILEYSKKCQVNSIVSAKNLCDSVKITEKKHGPNNILTAHVLANQALNYDTKFGKHSEATPIYRLALDIYIANNNTPGPVNNNPEVKETLQNLVKILKKHNRNDEAKTVLQEVLFGKGSVKQLE